MALKGALKIALKWPEKGPKKMTNYMEYLCNIVFIPDK